MNNLLSNALVNAIATAMGIPLSHWLDELERMQWWDADRMHAWQQTELQQIFRYASSRVPYYREAFRGREIDVRGDVREGLRGLPVLRKETVRDRFQFLCSEELPRVRYQDMSTSGSTGKPLRLIVDDEAFGRYFAASCALFDGTA